VIPTDYYPIEEVSSQILISFRLQPGRAMLRTPKRVREGSHDESLIPAKRVTRQRCHFSCSNRSSIARDEAHRQIFNWAKSSHVRCSSTGRRVVARATLGEIQEWRVEASCCCTR
ncbi:hypothetical protein L915_08785, partial [Phytophthora nicotianae]